LNCSTTDHNLCLEVNDFALSYNYYRSYQGPGQKSGAYIFRPDNDTLYGSIPYATPVKGTVHEGQILTIVAVEGERVSYKVKFYNDDHEQSHPLSKIVEIETYV